MRLSEVYTSVQGEGPRVGIPTIFVRFAGCNLRCPGWACDTPYAIFPAKYRDEWLTIGSKELWERIRKEEHYKTVSNICMTGGEPFLQLVGELYDLCRLLFNNGKKVEFFSNGTLPYPHWTSNCNVVMDWKLPGSGEVANEHNLSNYELLTRWPGNALKFTIADRSDFDTALEVAQKLHSPSLQINRNIPVEVFCGPVWGKLEPEKLVGWMLEAGVPWRLNLQVHKYIFGDKRGI